MDVGFPKSPKQPQSVQTLPEQCVCVCKACMLVYLRESQRHHFIQDHNTHSLPLALLTSCSHAVSLRYCCLRVLKKGRVFCQVCFFVSAICPPSFLVRDDSSSADLLLYEQVFTLSHLQQRDFRDTIKSNTTVHQLPYPVISTRLCVGHPG